MSVNFTYKTDLFVQQESCSVGCIAGNAACPAEPAGHAMEMGRRLYLWRLLRESPAVTEDEPTMPLRSSMAAAMNMRVDATQQVVARERWGLSRANTKMQTLASNSTTPNNRDFIVHP
ncbi:hypothetical protein [Glutamicibacter protophormiae]